MTGILQPRLYFVLLAGGASLRAGGGDGSAPKQFRDAGGEMLLMRSLRELIRAPGVARAVLVVAEAWRPLVAQTLQEAALSVPWHLADAGPHRTASAWHALVCLAGLPPGQRPAADDLIAIHDAARPFASRHLLARVARAAARHGAAVPGVPVADTIVQLEPAAEPAPAPEEFLAAEEPAVASYLERSSLIAVQTPQVARWRELYDAHAWAAGNGRAFTDDGGLLAARGLSPAVVMGEAGNWKITTEDDWQRAVSAWR